MKFGSRNRNLMRDVYRYGTILETHGDGDSITLTFTIHVSMARKLGFYEKQPNMNLEIS